MTDILTPNTPSSASADFPTSNPPSPDDQLLPIRMLNEFTYCPRLGYLEWVQGEWADNLETREGTFGHRNVDHPDRADIPAPDANTGADADADADPLAPESNATANRRDPPDAEQTEPLSIHSRSLSLSAPSLGLIAKMDLVEIEGHHVTPVDYKRGQVPDIPEGAYEPERVQLCAQGLILRENGFTCEEGVIYYIASRKRVAIPFDDALIARVKEQIQAFRATADAGVCPPPLEDSPKCPRCSLVGICLPDEVNFLREHPETIVLGHGAGPARAEDQEQSTTTTTTTTTLAGPAARAAGARARVVNLEHPPRRLIPTRDDALPLYVQDQGVMIGKSGERLTLSRKGEQIKTVRLVDVSQVCVFGSVMFSAQALRELTVRGAPVCHFTYGGWFHGMTMGFLHKNVELRMRQFQLASSTERSLPLARAFVSGKIRNCRTFLRRNRPETSSVDVNIDWILDQLDDYRRRAEKAQSVETLLGLEGMAAKTYFSGFFRCFPNDSPDLQVENRNRRPPRDPVNAVLSFVYSLLVKDLNITLQAVGFDPLMGFYHTPRYGRPSLALDVAEEFRPLIGDSVALTVFNNGEVGPSGFLRRAGAVAMTDAARRAVIAAYERRMNHEITHPMF